MIQIYKRKKKNVKIKITIIFIINVNLVDPIEFNNNSSVWFFVWLKSNEVLGDLGLAFV
jgi:hypothetical protein